MTTLILHNKTGQWFEPTEAGQLVPIESVPLTDYDPLSGEFVPYAPEPEQTPEIAFGDVLAHPVVKFAGQVVWFVLAIPLAVVVHVGMALFAPTKHEPPNEPYGSRRPQRARRVTYEKETFYQREKYTSD